MDRDSPRVSETTWLRRLAPAALPGGEPAGEIDPKLGELFPPPAPAREAHHGRGHRARLRQRLIDGGPDALLDHELVEYLLALAIPRRDTKKLAKDLLAEFGGFGRLLSADAATIARVGFIIESEEATLKVAQDAANRLLE